jgi:signal transduction histidine kinase
MPIVLLIAAVASLLALFFGLRYVVRPLQKLDTQADRIGQGDFDAVAESVGGVKEIEDLRRTLDRMARQVQRYQAALEGYLGALTQAQEEERARLARELHDGTVQTLIALGQQTQLVQRVLGRDRDRAAARLAGLRKMIGEAVEEVRRVSRALRPLYLEELGLVPALEMPARETGAVFWINGSTRRLGADQELALYRIAQEALSNTQRHAKARQINMSLTFVEESVTLRVQDDGTGFLVPGNFTEFARNGHFGLLGMHERAQHAGGRLTLTSAVGHGTVVEVRLADEPQVTHPQS